MKSILIATDFSANAKHAAEYGFKLAKQLKENVVLCNAFLVLAEMPEAGTMAWPQYEYDELMKDSADELTELENTLVRANAGTVFQPFIKRISEDGQLPVIINKAVTDHKVGLVVMGMHGNTGLSSLMLGNHSRRMIDDAVCPLLLIPAETPIAPIKKVAFATDFKEPEKDLEAIFDLIPTLKQLGAELLLTHICEDIDQAWGFKENVRNYLTELSNKANYNRIYYRMVKSESPEKGLKWLSEHGQVDVIAMVHRSHSFLDRLLNGSHTQKMAKVLAIPLLVIPGK